MVNIIINIIMNVIVAILFLLIGISFGYLRKEKETKTEIDVLKKFDNYLISNRQFYVDKLNNAHSIYDLTKNMLKDIEDYYWKSISNGNVMIDNPYDMESIRDVTDWRRDLSKDLRNLKNDMKHFSKIISIIDAKI